MRSIKVIDQPGHSSRCEFWRVQLFSELPDDREMVGGQRRVCETDVAATLRRIGSTILPDEVWTDTRSASCVLSLHAREAPREVRGGP